MLRVLHVDEVLKLNIVEYHKFDCPCVKWLDLMSPAPCSMACVRWSQPYGFADLAKKKTTSSDISITQLSV